MRPANGMPLPVPTPGMAIDPPLPSAGTGDGMGDKTSIRLEQNLDKDPATVWTYLTTPDLVAAWWAPCTIKAEPGHRFTFDLGKWGIQAAEILAIEPEKRLSYTFAPTMIGTTITWTLAPTAGGTLLTMTHEGFDLSSMIPRMAYDGLGKGWPKMLEKLRTTVAAAT